MYEPFFGFLRHPFQAASSADDYFFPAQSIQSAHQTLRRVIERSEGIGLLIGPNGTGKTALLKHLAADLREEFAVVYLNNGHAEMTRRELLQSILFELDLPYRGVGEGELRLALLAHLAEADRPTSLALLIDDAQQLPPGLLEELRKLADVEVAGAPRIRLVIAGTARLEETLGGPQLEAFSQRIAARCYLETFDRDETCAFVAASVASAGGQADRIFTHDALDNIYRASDGIARLVNQLCDASLLMACERNLRQVDGHLVQEAWAELQQLPSPWEAAAPTADSDDNTGIIEFGELGEGGDDDDTSVIEFGHMEQPGQDDSVLQELHRDGATEQPPAAEETPAETSADELAVCETAAETLDEPPSKPLLPPLKISFEEEEHVCDHYAALDAFRGLLPSQSIHVRVPQPGGSAEEASVMDEAELESLYTLMEESRIELEKHSPDDGSSSEPRTDADSSDEPLELLTIETRSDAGDEVAELRPTTADVQLDSASDLPLETSVEEVAAACWPPTDAEPAARADDEDVIVLDETLSEMPEESEDEQPRITPVAGHDYRRIFARLRRGTTGGIAQD